jgi:hypothetical protein
MKVIGDLRSFGYESRTEMLLEYKETKQLVLRDNMSEFDFMLKAVHLIKNIMLLLCIQDRRAYCELIILP